MVPSGLATRCKGPFTPSIGVNAARTSNEASDTVIIENNEVTQKWVALPLWSD